MQWLCSHVVGHAVGMLCQSTVAIKLIDKRWLSAVDIEIEQYFGSDYTVRPEVGYGRA